MATQKKTTEAPKEEAKDEVPAAPEVKAEDAPAQDEEKYVDVIVRKIPNNNGFIKLNGQTIQLTADDLETRMQVPEGFAASFPTYFAAPGKKAVVKK